MQTDLLREDTQKEQIDLTGRSLYEVHATSLELLGTDRASGGCKFLLRGDRSGDHQLIEPRDTQFGNTNEMIKAVFATDTPILAMARAAGGPRLELWKPREILFGARETAEDFPRSAYLYLLPKDGFEIDIDSANEMHTKEPVLPALVQKFDTKIIIPAFRLFSSVSERNKVWMTSALDIAKEGRPVDLDLAVLMLKTRVEQMGVIDGYTTDGSVQGDELDRLTKLIFSLGPILEKVIVSGNALQIQTLNNTVQRFRELTWEVENNFSNLILKNYREVDMLFSHFKQR